MQQNKIISGLIGLIWAISLLLIGSDSVFMPLPNIIGLIIFGVVNFLVCKKYKTQLHQH